VYDCAFTCACAPCMCVRCLPSDEFDNFLLIAIIKFQESFGIKKWIRLRGSLWADEINSMWANNCLN